MGNAEDSFRAALALNSVGQPSEAIELFEQAAAEAHGPACFAMASVLATGQFVDYDPEAAFDHLQTGFESGDSQCGLALSSFYASGIGRAPSWKCAIDGLSDLAQASNTVARRELGLLALLQGDLETAGKLLFGAARDAHVRGDAIAKALVLPSLNAGDGLGELAQSFTTQIGRAGVQTALLNNRSVFPPSCFQSDVNITSAAALAANRFAQPQTNVVHAQPDISIAKDAISPVALDYVILSAIPFLKPSRIADPDSGQTRADAYRTGDAATFSPMQQTPVLIAIREMMCAAVRAPLERGEFLSVIAYRPGQEYRSHYDAFLHPSGEGGRGHDGEFDLGGQRTHTVLLNLNDAFEGGETCFPEIDVVIKPRSGQIITFANVDDSGARDPRSLHFGAKIESGAKFLASQWIREKRYRPAGCGSGSN